MSDIIYVSTTEELYDALATCTGGETILLEGGEYGELYLVNTSYSENVTIAPVDPTDPPVFSTMKVSNVENLTLDGLYFDYTFSDEDPYYYLPFQIADSSNVTVVNCTFDGDVAEGVSEIDDGYGWAYGLSVRDCTNVDVVDNEIFGFMRGLVVSESDMINVIGNDVHSVRMDGMTFSEVTNVVIAENYIHDFAGSPDSGDHCDMIQFWTNGDDSPSTNVVIENNVLDIGDGTPAQSIFMRNEEVDTGAAGEEMYYQAITITGNVIVNGHLHGITVGETDGLLIENNTVVHADGIYDDGLDEEVEIPAINVAEDSTNVTISQNITGGVDGYIGQEDWTVTGNVIVQDQDPNSENYYGDVFITSTLVPEDGVHAYVAVPGGVIEQTGAGAASTLSPEIDGVIEAHFQIAATPDNAAVRHFDASLTLTSLESLPEGTTYTWDFGDGTIATGIQVSHAFPDGGVYPVTLTVTLPDGTTDSQGFDVGIEGPTLLTLQDGQFTAYDLGEALNAGTTGSQEGVVLDGTGVATTVSREHVADIEGSDDIRIQMTLQADSANSVGEVARLHSSFIVSVRDDGEILVQLFSETGEELRLLTVGANMHDLAVHELVIEMNENGVEVLFDGAVVATAEPITGLVYTGNHDLTFGHPWEGDTFEGTVSALEITANADDFEAAAVLPEEPITEDPVVEEPVAEEPVAEEPETHGNGNGNVSMMARIFEFLKSLLGLQSTIRAEVDDMEAADTSEADKLALDEDEQINAPDSMAA